MLFEIRAIVFYSSVFVSFLLLPRLHAVYDDWITANFATYGISAQELADIYRYAHHYTLLELVVDDPDVSLEQQPSFAELIEWSKIPHVPYNSLRRIRRRVRKFVSAHSSTRFQIVINRAVRTWIDPSYDSKCPEYPYIWLLLRPLTSNQNPLPGIIPELWSSK